MQIQMDNLISPFSLLTNNHISLIGFSPKEINWFITVLSSVRANVEILNNPLEREITINNTTPGLLIVKVANEYSISDQSINTIIRNDEPVLFVGDFPAIQNIIQKVSTFNNNRPLHDFLVAPFTGEELLLRANQLTLTQTHKQKHDEKKRQKSSFNVIVADDDATVIVLVKAVMKRLSAQCHVAENGGKALALARTMQPDLFILDINMPDKDGFEVLYSLRNDPQMADVPIIMITARQQEADVLRGFELGASDYLIKPFNPMELAVRAKRLLNN